MSVWQHTQHTALDTTIAVPQTARAIVRQPMASSPRVVWAHSVVRSAGRPHTDANARDLRNTQTDDARGTRTAAEREARRRKLKTKKKLCRQRERQMATQHENQNKLKVWVDMDMNKMLAKWQLQICEFEGERRKFVKEMRC